MMNNLSTRFVFTMGPAGIRNLDTLDPFGDPIPRRNRHAFDPATERFLLAPLLVFFGSQPLIFWLLVRI